MATMRTRQCEGVDGPHYGPLAGATRTPTKSGAGFDPLVGYSVAMWVRVPLPGQRRPFRVWRLRYGAMGACSHVWRAQERVRYPLFGRKAGHGVEAAQRLFSRRRMSASHSAVAADPNSSGRTLNAIRHLSVGKPGRDGKPCGERPRESVPCSGSWSGDSAGLLNRKWWVRFPHRAFGSAPRRLMRVSDNQPPRG